MDKTQQKFTFEVDNITGLNLGMDRLDKVIIQITATGLREAQDNIRNYLYKSYLKADKIILQKIEF